MSSQAPRALRALVSGRVQGVAFRHYTRERANTLGLAGEVRNLADGRVEVLIEGAPRAVQELIDWLSAGPPFARVASVEVEERTPTGRQSFEIVG